MTDSAEKLISVGIPTPTIEIRVPPRYGSLKLSRTHVNATQVSGATHTLEVVGANNGMGWGNTAVGDYVIFDIDSARVTARVTALAIGGDKDKINVFAVESSRSFAALDKRVNVYWASNIVLSPESPLWIQAVYDVEPGVAHFLRAGIDHDRDQCEAQADLYDLGNGARVFVLSGHSDRVNDVAFAPNGELIATCSDDGTVRLYGTADGAFKASYTGVGQINAIAFSPDGALLALGQSNGDVVLTDVVETAGIVSITLDRTFSSHTAEVNDVAFSPDGTQLLSGANDRRAILWSVPDGTILRDSPHTLGVNAVAFSPREPILVATGSEEGIVRIWNNTSGIELIRFVGHEGPVNDLVFSPDGSVLYTASDDNTAKAWAPLTGEVLDTFVGHTNDVVSVAISPDGNTLITGSADATARLWNAATAETVNTVQPCVSTISSVAVSPDGEQFLTGVAAGNDIQLDTDPPNGNDLNITQPQPLSLKTVSSLGGLDVEPGRYFLWAEIDTDQTAAPVRAYADANVNVVKEFTTTVGSETPVIPLVNNQASVVLPHSQNRQIFDLGPVDTGDRLFVSLLSTPGLGEYYEPEDEFSVMVLDADSRIFTWYEALRSFSFTTLNPTLDRFVLFTPDTKLVVGPYSSHAHFYVVADGGISVSVRIDPDTNLFGPRQQRVFVNFNGAPAVAVGGQPPLSVPSFNAADFNQFFQFSPHWGTSETATMRGVIMATLQTLYSRYYVAPDDANTSTGVKFYRSDVHDPADIQLPYLTVYVGGSDPYLSYGVADYVDPRNETTTGSAVVYATTIAEDGIGGAFANPITSDPADLASAIGTVAAYEIGHLLGLRDTDDSTDLMQLDGDPTLPRAFKGGSAALSPLVSEYEQVDSLAPIGHQDALLLLRETVGEVN